MWPQSSVFASLAPELHTTIISYLDKPSDIYAVALTCRSLSPPALDHLWREVDVYSIVASLPDELFFIDKQEDRKLYFLDHNRMIYPEDLTFFQRHYAPRIRSLRQDPKHSRYRVDPKVFSALQLATDGKHGALTPNLRSFTWTLGDFAEVGLLQGGDEEKSDALLYMAPSQYLEEISPFLNLFIGSTVTSLSFDLHGPTFPFPLSRAAMYMAAKRLSSTLESLTIGARPGYRNMDPIDGFLKQFDWINLTSLDLCHILHPDRDIPYLATLPNLKALTVTSGGIRRMQESTYLGLPAPSVGAAKVTREPGFFALENLSIRAADVQHWTDVVPPFLEHLSPQNSLTRFAYVGKDSMSASDAEEMFELLTQSLNPNTLQSLEIQDQRVYVVPPEDSIPHDPPFRKAASISQLSSFKNLQKLGISLTDGVRITTADIQDLAARWPQLTHLDLRPTSLPAHSPWIDHYQLVDLTVACPKLSVIGIPFDATRVDGNEDLASSRVLGVQTIHTWGSTLVRPTQVAVFLKRTFPRLKMLNFVSPCEAMFGSTERIRLDLDKWWRVDKTMDSDLRNISMYAL